MIYSTLLYFGFINLLTFVCYAYDKMAARKNNWRISENTMHLLSLGGGWVGARFAQKLFRHKTVKQPFQSFFWCTVALNLAFTVFSVIESTK